jgi:hypothetical protein
LHCCRLSAMLESCCMTSFTHSGRVKLQVTVSAAVAKQLIDIADKLDLPTSRLATLAINTYVASQGGHVTENPQLPGQVVQLYRDGA